MKKKSTPPEEEMAIVAGQDPNFRLAPRLFPDALALIASLLIFVEALRTRDLDEPSLTWVSAVLGGELFTFFLVVALVGIASRRRQPPSLWGGLLTVAVLLIVFPTVWVFARAAWSAGVWVFLPFAWSMIERFRQLWTLPLASRLEKLRARALAFDRFQTGLTGYFLMFFLLIGTMVSDDPDFPHRAAAVLLPGFLVVFFAIACLDQVRVHTESFARAPRRLWARPGRPDPTLTEMKPI